MDLRFLGDYEIVRPTHYGWLPLGQPPAIYDLHQDTTPDSSHRGFTDSTPLRSRTFSSTVHRTDAHYRRAHGARMHAYPTVLGVYLAPLNSHDDACERRAGVTRIELVPSVLETVRLP